MAELTIIYENADFLIVNKPAGLMVHPVKRKMGDRASGIGHREDIRGNEVPVPRAPCPMPEFTLVDWLLARYPEIKTVGDDPAQRPGIVHRLDKGTSGVMVAARNQASFEYLKALFQKHEVMKTYLAVVAGKPKKETGVIDAPIGIFTGSTRRSVRSATMAKEAVTEYKVIGYRGSGMGHGEDNDAGEISISDSRFPIPGIFSLLEVRPKTGRTHQIRVHLASIGCPILGDQLYGTRASRAAAPRLMLHALSLEFVTSDGKKMRFEAEPPEEFEQIIEIASR